MGVSRAIPTSFEVREPAQQSVPFVFNSPHSGRVYPRPFLQQSRLDARAIRRSEDHFVDELFAAGRRLGAPLLAAHFPRAFLDVNREPYELDPRMFEGTLPPFANIASMRVAGGLGTIPRMVAENMEIYRHRLPVAEALERIERIYKPYHDTLRRLIAATHVALRPRRADRLPFHAGQSPRDRQRPCGRTSSSATATAPARTRQICRTAAIASRRLGYSVDPQQALCRRLHHRALRPSGARPACAADRDQPRPLHR